MKESDLLTLLDDIPDAWIASAATPQKHAVPFLRYGIPAIAACITAVTALAVYPRFRPPAPPDIMPAATTYSTTPIVTTTQRSTTTISTAPAVTTITVTSTAPTTEMMPVTVTEAVPQTVETTETKTAPITTALSVTTHSAVTTITVTSTAPTTEMMPVTVTEAIPQTVEATEATNTQACSVENLLTVSVQKSEPSTPETATQASASQPLCSFRLLTDAEAQEYMDFAHYQYLQIFVSGNAENVDLLNGIYDHAFLSLEAVFLPSDTYTEMTFILQLPNDMAISTDACFLHFTQADTPEAYASMLPESFVIQIMNTERWFFT